MTEREGTEESQLSLALDFVPLRQGALGSLLHLEKIISCSHFYSWP